MAFLSDNADRYIAKALEEARASLAEGGVPVGAVLVERGEVIGSGRNRTIQTGDPTAHAELECIRAAGRRASYKDVILYSTVVPCHMCAGALVQFGIEYVVAAEAHNTRGAWAMLKDHWIEVERLNDEDCIGILKRYIEEHPERKDAL